LVLIAWWAYREMSESEERDAQNRANHAHAVAAAQAHSIAMAHAEQQRRAKLWEHYQWCLRNMTTDKVARTQVADAGRAWYSYLRGGVPTTYDELAIANDIKAAGG
jgi:hypothetical protein